MITHKIIKYRPRIKAVVENLLTNNYTNWVSHRKLKNSQEFEEWLDAHPFKIGNLIALDSNQVSEPYKVHMITEINRDYHMLDWDKGASLPKCFKIVQLKGVDNTIGKWIRWDSPAGYRFLSEEEVAHIKEKHNDSIQDCLALCRPATDTQKP